MAVKEDDQTSSKSLSKNIYEPDGKSPAGWVRRDPEPEEMPDLIDYISNELGFLEGVLDKDKMDSLSSSGSWEWELYQQKYFEVGTWFAMNKCRQSGGSAMLAAKPLAKAMLAQSNFICVFTSYVKEEAINKIQYVKQYLECLPPRFKKKIVRDPNQLIEFENANKTRVLILSHPQKSIRGLPANHIGLDELAFYQWADEIYGSTIPATAMTQGVIDVISTPFGKSGKFYEIFSDRVKYPEFFRLSVMWWNCIRYLKDNTFSGMLDAYKLAPYMTTEERVYQLGNKSIKILFENSPDLETFQQEFEGLFVDEQAAFFSKDLILSVMYDATSDANDYDPRDGDFKEFVNGGWKEMTPDKALEHRKSLVEERYENVLGSGKPIKFKKFNTLEEVWNAKRNGTITGRLIAGVDVGTTRNSTDFRIFEEVSLVGGEVLQIERFSLSRSDWRLEDQQIYFESVLRRGFIDKMGMDVNGISLHMGQYLKKRFYANFIEINLGGHSRLQEEIMVCLKTRMDTGTIALSRDKKVIEQIYSIQRVVRENQSVGFKAPEKGRHHADAAWSIAIAAYIGTPPNTRASSFSGPTSPSSPIITGSRGIIKSPTVPEAPVSQIARALGVSSGGGGMDRARVVDHLITGGFISNYDE